MTGLTLCLPFLAALAQAPSSVTDLDGRAIDPWAGAGDTRVTVLIFTRSDCPVASQAAPEIERVRSQFASRGVKVWLVYVDPAESAEQIREHQRQYQLGVRALRDPDHQLVRRTGVRVTPESAVYVHESPEPRLVYRGRLDDRVLSPGTHRLRPTAFDLRDAIETALRGVQNTLKTTPAYGCEIADLRTP
jgi:peroxiredoxin